MELAKNFDEALVLAALKDLPKPVEIAQTEATTSTAPPTETAGNTPPEVGLDNGFAIGAMGAVAVGVFIAARYQHSSKYRARD